LRKRKYNKKVIADLGCGEAYLARQLDQKVYSFDLVNINEYITQCDLKNIPLEDDNVDIAIFCLSLMGNNFIDFIVEAKRILKPNGLLIVCEITSRIVSSERFVSVFKQLGFVLSKQNDIKNYFTLFVFRLCNKIKDKLDREGMNSFDILKPCLYKKR
jgi:ribosomal RNA-processing protein 8